MSVPLLLDTQTVIWALINDPRLKPRARTAIEAAEANVWVSAVSFWEIAIKHPMKRSHDPMPFSARQALVMVERSGMQCLSVSAVHAAAVDELPTLHADPFDRLLLAQARATGLTLLTSDEKLLQYGHGVMSV